MLNGIYLTSENMNNLGSGVRNKILNHINVLEKNNIKIKLVSPTCYNKLDYFLHKINRMFISIPDYINLNLVRQLSNVNFQEVDFIYVRKGILDKNLLQFFLKLKESFPNIKTLLEIPTYPYDEEMKSYLRKRDLQKELGLRVQLKNCFDRIVTYSDDKEIFGVRTIQIANGVNYDKISIRNKNKFPPNKINLIAVALFDTWHGYDRVIEGLRQYYSTTQKIDIQLHLVGDGSALKSYKQLISKYQLTDQVHCHGRLFNKELDDVYNSCDIALDALGRHRSGVYFNSTLKGKEYCAKGFPVVSGVKTELDYLEEYLYYLRVPSNETPIDMDIIINFYQNMYKKGINNSQNIREITYTKFDMKYAFLPVIKFVKNKII